jgi:predicted  nucleic acid-binding Zn-ribbon protein
MGAEVRIGLSEFEAIKDAKKKAEDELKESKQSHKEEISDLKSTIKDLENKSRVIIKHKDKYFCRPALDEEILKKLKWNLQCSYNSETSNLIDMVYLWNRENYGAYQILDKSVDIVAGELRNIFVEATEKVIPLFSDQSEPDQYIGFDDIKLEVERELKDQYINNQKKIQEKLEQQIKDYEDKYQKVDEELQSKYDERIRVLEGNLINSKGEVCSLKETHKEEVDKLKETHKEEVDKLKEKLKEAQKTQEEKILDAETKLKEAQELLKKLTNNPHKKWWQFWK